MKIHMTSTSPIGTNTYLVQDEVSGMTFVMDPGSYTPGLKEMIKETGAAPEYIILTHGHGDHIMGVEGIRADYPSVKVAAHEAEKEMLADARYNVSADFGNPTEIEADIWLRQGDEIILGDLKLEFIHTPGHSPGGMCIYIASENVLFCGDTLFQGSIGRTDFQGGSFPVLEESIHSRLWPLPDETKVYPGHMGATTIGYEKENNPFV